MVNLTLLFEWSAFSVLRGLVRIVVLWMEVPLVVPFVFANRLFLTVTFDTVNPSSDEVEEEDEEPLSLEVELRSFRWKSASSINSILCGVGGDCGGVVPRLWGDRVMTPTGANLGLFGSNVKSGIFFSAVEISVDFFGLAGWEILAATKSFSRGSRIWIKSWNWYHIENSAFLFILVFLWWCAPLKTDSFAFHQRQAESPASPCNPFFSGLFVWVG